MDGMVHWVEEEGYIVDRMVYWVEEGMVHWVEEEGRDGTLGRGGGCIVGGVHCGRDGTLGGGGGGGVHWVEEGMVNWVEETLPKKPFE